MNNVVALTLIGLFMLGCVSVTQVQVDSVEVEMCAELNSEITKLQDQYGDQD